MSKRCARCEKTVYPLEELKCLDKIWHKGCFKCQECAMTLSMKTYKGFNKLPYCEAHIPKAKATTVAETPELKRLAENTKIQSNVQYHADFEKNKAKFTQVADDPETIRIKNTTKIISNVAYHGELERKAEMERKRDYEDDGKAAAAPREDSRRHQQPAATAAPQPPQSTGAPPSSGHMPPPQQQQQPPPQHHHHHHQNATAYPPQQHHYQMPLQQQQPPPTSSAYHHLHHQHPHPHQPPQQNLYHDANHNSPYSSRTSQTVIYTSQTGPVQQQPGRRVGSIADYDPINDQYGSISSHPQHKYPGGGYRQEMTYQVQRNNLYGDANNTAPTGPNAAAPTGPSAPQKRCYRAMYDYEAADTDEITFQDGDYIINCTAIDEGWMTGTVQRTGQTGMLPANYVERVN